VKVIINTISVSPSKVGIRTYLTNTLRALLEADPRNEYVLVCGRHNREIFEPFVARHPEQARLLEVGLTRMSAPLRILYDQFVLPRVVRGMRDAVLLEPSNVTSFRVDLPTVLVVQGALSIRELRRCVPRGGGGVSLFHRAYFDMALPASLRRADRVVAVSGYVRDALVRGWPFCRDKLRVVHEGVDSGLFGAEDEQSGSVASGEGYLLSVGTLFPYKNVDLVLRALAIVRARPGGESLRLKVAGKDTGGRYLGPLQELASDLGVADSVDWLGPIDHLQMPSLYRGASSLIYPSSVESFGLPLLEAMACGVPVVACRRAAVPEVVGDAGVLVEPTAPALAQAIQKVRGNSGFRSGLIARGRVRASEFSWGASARRLIAVLEEAGRLA
jgi:glycosyltransferase involved in cell wall biosynthesis